MFALVGACIGAATGLVLYLSFAAGMSALLAAALACTFSTVVTGALHEDGLADTCDGFGGGKDREQRLLIMRDSRIGTYGAVGLILTFLMRVFALESLLSYPLLSIMAVCAAAAAFSRAMMVDLMWASKPARSDGLSAYAGQPSRNVTFAAILSGGLFTLAVGFLFQPQSGVIALACATLATATIRLLSMRMIGGQTGDVCGAAQVCSEVAMLAAFAATID
jgi:adenosylcobinamide-GDP ribazoletransferase